MYKTLLHLQGMSRVMMNSMLPDNDISQLSSWLCIDKLLGLRKLKWISMIAQDEKGT